jgi:methionine-rich copper-binding protein CopC
VTGRRNPCHTRIALAASLAATLAWPGLGWPHAALVKASPPSRAVVTRPPERVQLWFNERLEAAFSRLRVVDGDGRQVDTGDVRLGPDDPKRLSVGLPPLAPGVYTVRYRVLSVDGHIVESRFSFTIRAPR